jgi:hypothetical protein
MISRCSLSNIDRPTGRWCNAASNSEFCSRNTASQREFVFWMAAAAIAVSKTMKVTAATDKAISTRSMP